MILHIGGRTGPLPAGTVTVLATDLRGNVVWYYDPVANKFQGYATSTCAGRHGALILGGTASGEGGESELREIDLAGDTVRETNVDALNAELAALGQDSDLSTSTTKPCACPTGTRLSWPVIRGSSTLTAPPPRTSATWSSSWTRTSRCRGSGTLSTGFPPAASPPMARARATGCTPTPSA